MTTWITGASMLTAHGQGRAHVFEQLCDGIVAAAPLRHLDATRFSTQHAYEIVDDDAHAARCTGWLTAVIAEAVAEAGLDPASSRVCVLVGTGLREQPALERWAVEGAPFSAAQWDFAPAVRAALGCEWPVYTMVNACAASLHCLALAEDMLALDQADAVVVAGTDAIAVSMFGLLDRVNTPAEAIEPFDQHRKGVLMGEGAAAVVLQGGTPARALAALRAVAMTCDAHHETAPDAAGIEAAVRAAHAAAGVAITEIDVVLAHATGTALNDDTEAAVLQRVFGSAAAGVRLTGIKAMTGHTAGASGLIGVVTAIEALASGRVPPTPGLRTPIAAAAAFDLVTAARAPAPLRLAQVNAFGFGGVNAVAIVEAMQ